MIIIYVASLAQNPDRDSEWINALMNMGHSVISFSSNFKVSRNPVLARIQRRLNIGPGNRLMQEQLIDLVVRIKPNWVHFRLPLEFDGDTIRQITKAGVIVTEYFNDDPFSPSQPIGLVWKFLKSLPYYHGHFVYRKKNLSDFTKAGSFYTEHLRPAYDPSRFYYSPVRSGEEYIADAAFIGHWENDNRCDYLEALIENGFHIIIRGGMWNRAISRRPLGVLSPIDGAFGRDYNHIYAHVTAGLCFFSKINNDTWTARPMEIIASGGVLVCERTSEAESYFVDRKEAFFFSSKSELCDIVNELKLNFALRQSVQVAGYKRLIKDSHCVQDRVHNLVDFVSRSSTVTESRR